MGMTFSINHLPGNESCSMMTFNGDNIHDCIAASIKANNIMNDSKVWINLTNGLEIVPYLKNEDVQFDMCRFASTYFEHKDWGAAIDAMPDDMLMRLALGQQQVIVDFGANKPCSRAMRQGIPIAVRMISHAWELDTDEHMWVFNRCGEPSRCSDEFAREAMRLNKKQKSRLAYFGKYLDTDTVNITMVCAPTKHDGDYDYYVDTVMQNV